jgi:predicted lipoprotein with Yx(FWY)xxD motif
LGETVEQTIHRYGKPTGFTEASAKTPFGTILFTASGYELVLFILNNKEVGARVSKLDKSTFTDIEMQNIMSSDSNESKWTSVASTDPSCLQWSRSDKATVLYDKDKRMLIFTSDEMIQALHASKEKSSPTN